MLARLAEEKLQKLAKCETKIWKWAEVDIDADYSSYRKFGRVYPKPVETDPKLQTELDGLRDLLSKLEENYDSDKWTGEDQEQEDKATDRVEEIETLINNSAVSTDEDHKLAGCIVTLSFRGEVHVEGGLVRPEDIPAEEPDTEEGDETEQSVNGETVSGPVIEMPSTTGGSVYPQDAATADNYWGRVNKAHALKMAKELIGASWSDDRSSMRKPEIAKSMENAFGETAHEAIGLNSEIADRTSRWLPDGVRFGDQEIVKSPVASENDAQ